MKTQFVRVWAAVATATSLIFCAGCEEDKAAAQVPVVSPATLPQSPPNSPLPAPGLTPTAAPAAAPAPVAAQVIQKARPPESLAISPALADIIKLTQAGVSDDVMLAYITNAPRVFAVGSEEILYLNDLGVSSAVITALLQNDNSPDVLALKKSGAAGNPLPAGLGLTVPATNVYPTTPAAGTQNVAEPAPPTYVAQPPVYQAEAPVEYVTENINVVAL